MHRTLTSLLLALASLLAAPPASARLLTLADTDAAVTGWYNGTALTDERRFDGFGNPYTGTATAAHYSTLGYRGQLTDKSGLIFLRNRYYDPDLARFISLDPIKDGSDWFAYPTDPVNQWDPEGLRVLVAADAEAEFDAWCSANTTINEKLQYGWPSQHEGARVTAVRTSPYGGHDPNSIAGKVSGWLYGLRDAGNQITHLGYDIRSTFAEVYPVASFSPEGLTENDQALLAMMTSEQVYIFDRNGWRTMTDADRGGWWARRQLAAQAAVAAPLNALGDMIEEHQAELVNLEMEFSMSPIRVGTAVPAAILASRSLLGTARLSAAARLGAFLAKYPRLNPLNYEPVMGALGANGLPLRYVGRGAAFRGRLAGTLHGMTETAAKGNLPKGWIIRPAEGNGWVMLDEAGKERLRFMRPAKEGTLTKWSRQRVGYWRRQNELGEYLDEFGEVVPRSDPNFEFRTHVTYSGAD